MIHEQKIKYFNIFLRQIEKCDLETIRKWRNDSKNTRFLTKIPHISPDMQKEWFDRYLDNQNEMFFVIEETKELKRLVGSLALYNFDKDKVEFGKFIIGDEDAHGKKIGLKAVKAILLIAFNILEMSQVYLHVYDKNVAAIRVYMKAGFKVVSEHRDSLGCREYVMSIEKQEFLSVLEENYA